MKQSSSYIKVEKIDFTYAIISNGKVYQVENYQPPTPNHNQLATKTKYDNP
ncbi:MAG: hypothetical protein F6K54_02190 [Okeania sp. SIO3B5]|uniref:hypothetical protein n=1 Tax=Okeania sp. SIO3B5 TaxID=2607811 RepID=UPI0013FE8CD8|nr:hypothetical protein [Okeania sp. SIO3B5]NEO52003.1 hypothetical protein [Okeania sp. SIO3B5]